LNIEKGMIFKNYNELCEFMNWNKARGNTKIAKLKELTSMCDWKREGNKIIINSVYINKKEIVDNRSKNNKYIDEIETILLYLLNNKKNNEMFISKAKLYKALGIFNKNIDDLYYKKVKDIADDLLVDYLTIRSFKISSKSEANKIINRALKRIEKRKKIKFMEGKILIEKSGAKRLATEHELFLFRKIEREVIKSLGCSSFAQVELKNLTNKYRNKVEEALLKSDIKEILFSFEGYYIKSNCSKLEIGINKSNKEMSVKKINELFYKRLVATSNVRHKSAKKKAVSKIEFGQPIFLFEASERYLEDYNTLIETYVVL
jgi:hypothetical protein